MLLATLYTSDPATANMINAALFFAFSGIAATLSGIIKQNHWPDWQNQLTVFIVGLLCAFLYVWVGSNFSGDFPVLFGGLAGAMVIVMSRFDPLIKWSDYLQASVLVLKGEETKLFVKPTSPERVATVPLVATNIEQSVKLTDESTPKQR